MWRRVESSLDRLGKCIQSPFELWILLQQCTNLFDGVEHSRVVLASKGPADLCEGGVREVTRQVHRYLAGEGHGLRPVLSAQVSQRDGVEVGSLPLDVFDRQDLLVVTPE